MRSPGEREGAMISDQERREVARRLREIREDEYGEVYMYDVMLALGVESGKAAYWADKEFIHHLADLIDRPTCRNVYDEVYDEYEGGCCENGFKCSKCGELVEDCEGYRVKGTFNFCPNCGAEVVPDGC